MYTYTHYTQQYYWREQSTIYIYDLLYYSLLYIYIYIYIYILDIWRLAVAASAGAIDDR